LKKKERKKKENWEKEIVLENFQNRYYEKVHSPLLVEGGF